jgi:hypothetical protein
VTVSKIDDDLKKFKLLAKLKREQQEREAQENGDASDSLSDLEIQD